MAFNLSKSEAEVTFAGNIFIMKNWLRFPSWHGSVVNTEKSLVVGIQVAAGIKYLACHLILEQYKKKFQKVYLKITSVQRKQC